MKVDGRLAVEGRRELDVLLEPRTLARSRLREGGIRRLVDEFLTGRRRHSRLLGTLPTLELLQQQQLVDGDGLPTDAGSAERKAERRIGALARLTRG